MVNVNTEELSRGHRAHRGHGGKREYRRAHAENAEARREEEEIFTTNYEPKVRHESTRTYNQKAYFYEFLVRNSFLSFEFHSRNSGIPVLLLYFSGYFLLYHFADNFCRGFMIGYCSGQ